MKECDGTALLTDETLYSMQYFCDYFCVDGYDDGDDVFVDVTSGAYPSEVSWEFYKSDGTAVTFYNENDIETSGTACQYVKSTTAACAQYDSGSGSCTSNSYSNSYSFDFGSSYDYSYSYSFANCPTNGCSGAYVKAMDSCKCISLEEFTIIVFFFFFFHVFLMDRWYCY